MGIGTIGGLVIGLALLVGGAEFLVEGASKLAATAGIPPLVIGLTVVALGTSAPELGVSLQASPTGQADIVPICFSIRLGAAESALALYH